MCDHPAGAAMADPAPRRSWLKRALLWELPLLAALGGFMFWVRMLPYQALVGSGRAYYIGTDPFYHYRETLGIVRAYPYVPRWDPWTFFPIGTGTGQFGSLFDWLCATVIVATRGTDAPESYVATVLGWWPALLGALMIIPFYFLARRLLGRPGAVVASITLALIPGEFLIRSIAGYSDHHVAEDLFSLAAILGVVVAVERGHAARDALARWRDVKGYRGALIFAILGGLALAANFYAWPPAILFLGILTVWLTLVVLLEEGRGADASGMVFGATVAFVLAGVLMIPSVETTFLGEYNTFGLLQPVVCFASALWLVAVLWTQRRVVRAGRSGWLVPGAIAVLALAGFFAVQVLLADVYGSLRWGLSWITGIGAPRTTLTIAEARPASFFCNDGTDRGALSCINDDLPIVAPLAVITLLAVAGFALWKRRRSDILLVVWSAVIFNATSTQIRFSYYAAVNMALMIGWIAARVAEATRLHVPADERPEAVVDAKKSKGRKTQRAASPQGPGLGVQLAAVAAVLLLLIPAHVVPTARSSPVWVDANIAPNSPTFYATVGDEILWFEGLDWMRNNTPDAGVDLGLIAHKPAAGELYPYPANSYGVLSWWDYGHWIETVAQRPPVANPFQQAAPFASLWFTERDPVRAEKMLDDWAQGRGQGVRYVIIDDEMALGKFGAITVWAHNNNASRAQWPDGDYVARGVPYRMCADVSCSTSAGTRNVIDSGPEYTQSMMGRLYDHDGAGLVNYRLVWEDPSYEVIGNILDQSDSLRGNCFHATIPSRTCPISMDPSVATRYQPGTIVPFASDAKAYGLVVTSRLKLYERVEGAQLVGAAAPGARVVASVQMAVHQPGGITRPFTYQSEAIADATGTFRVTFPYATTGLLDAAHGGTNTIVTAQGQVTVRADDGRQALLDVPDEAVLRGTQVSVALG